MARRVQDAIEKISTLPALPSVLARILSVVGDPDASALELGRLIASDQSLSAGLLRVVNSAAYGYPRQVDSITQAIVILGFYEIRNLALAAVAFRSLPCGHAAFDRRQLWRHSLSTAIAAERIVKKLPLSTHSAFMAGLLHDIGKVALDALYPDLYQRCVKQARARGVPIREMESSMIGMDHAAVGALLGRHWNLPAALIAAMEWHHSAEPPEPERRLAILTALADHLAYQSGFGESGNVKPPEFPANAVELGGVDAVAAGIVVDLSNMSGQIDELLGALAD